MQIRRLVRLPLLLSFAVLAVAALACGAEDDSDLGAVPPPPDVTVVTVLERATPTGTPTPVGTAAASARGVSASGCEPVSNPQTVTTSTGLQYVDECVGNGPTPRNGDTVVVHYTGTLTNGTKFDSSRDRNQPFPFKLGQGEVIKGWDEGIATMKLGTKRKLIIPPDLAYGSRGQGPIPPNSTLNFDVELLEIR